MKKLNKGFLAYLKSQMLHLAEIRTVDGKDLSVDGDVEVGKDIYIANEDGEYEPAPSGEYDDGERVIVVEAGRIVEIREKQPEQPAEEPAAPEEAAEDEPPAEPSAEEAEIDSLRAENERLRNENEELRARIAELEGRVNEMAAVPSVEDEQQDAEPTTANKFITAAHKRQ